MDCVAVDCLVASKQETSENVNNLIEILDSSDEDEMVKVELHESVAQDHDTLNKTASKASTKDDSGSSGTEARRTETNGSSAGNSSTAGTSPKDQFDKTAATSSSSVTYKQSRLSADKRYKCKLCPRSFDFQCRLNVHNKLHIRAKSMGVVQDDNGLYSCSLCSHQYYYFRSISSHMTRYHSNGQPSFFAHTACGHSNGHIRKMYMKYVVKDAVTSATCANHLTSQRNI